MLAQRNGLILKGKPMSPVTDANWVSCGLEPTRDLLSTGVQVSFKGPESATTDQGKGLKCSLPRTKDAL